jgi:hypothetical protein
MRRTLLLLLVLETVVVSENSRLWAQPLTAHSSPECHVRGTEAWIATTLQKGVARSATFRRLIVTLDASDVIVHVQRLLLRNSLHGFLSSRLVTGGNYRYLRIGVIWRGNETLLIGTMAHELQHAIEVARTPDVRTMAEVLKLFDRSSFPCGVGDCNETSEALHVQDAVIEDLKIADRETSIQLKPDAGTPTPVPTVPR